jgi:ribonuclease PH
MTDSGMVVEIQGTAESAPFPQSQFTEMMGLATDGIKKLTDIQKKALKI